MLPHLPKMRTASLDGVPRLFRYFSLTVVRFPPKKIREARIIRGNMTYVSIYELLIRFFVGGDNRRALASCNERYGSSVNFM